MQLLLPSVTKLKLRVTNVTAYAIYSSLESTIPRVSSLTYSAPLYCMVRLPIILYEFRLPFGSAEMLQFF